MRVCSRLAVLQCLIAFVIFLSNPPAGGYEISIYEAFPDIFWILVIGGYAAAFVSVVFAALESNPTSRAVALPLMTIVFLNILVILLPLSRGYFLNDQTDEVSHLGMIMDLALTGRANENLYPISHILAHQLVTTCNLDPMIVMKLVPALFYMLLMLGVFLLARELRRGLGVAAMITAFASILYFGYYAAAFYPTQFFLSEIPLVLFVVWKRRWKLLNRSTVLIALVLPLPFLHPMGSLFLILILLLYDLSHKITARFDWQKKGIGVSKVIPPMNVTVRLGTLVGVILLLWFSNFLAFHSSITKGYEWLFFGSGSSGADALVGIWNTGAFSVTGLLSQVIRQFGHLAILSLLTAGILLTSLSKKSRFRQSRSFDVLFFALMFFSLSVVFVIAFFGSFTSTAGLSVRMLLWTLIPSWIIAGIFFQGILVKNGTRRRVLYAGFLCLLLVAAAIAGALSTHYSPYVNYTNQEVTEMNWNGMIWFYTAKTDDRTIYFNQFAYRAADALYGYESPRPSSIGTFELPPPHLGYDSGDSLGLAVEDRCYVIVDENTREFKSILWPDVGLFTLDDLNRLETDSQVNRIFSNGDPVIYYVIPS